MPRFYVPQTFVAGEVLRLPENVCQHIQVLRLQAGEPLVLFDGQGQAAEAELLEIGRKQALVRVDKLLAESRESPLAVTLIQAVSASEKMDFAVQKGTELGVKRIVPAVSMRSNVRLSGERAEKKVRRWQEIAISACEQCGRNEVPPVAPIADLPRRCAAAQPAAGAKHGVADWAGRRVDGRRRGYGTLVWVSGGTTRRTGVAHGNGSDGGIGGDAGLVGRFLAAWVLC